MSDLITLRSDTGEAIAGALALPTARAPGVVLVHEFWGLNDHIRAQADRLAGAGFAALAVDLYRGVVATDREQASRLADELPRARALADIAGAVRHLSAHPGCTGQVAVMGFCMGGALAFRAAAEVPGVAAAVPWYGIPADLPFERVRCPVQAHFASRDGWAKPELGLEAQRRIVAAGGAMTLHVYEADHAFGNDTRPRGYDRDAAELAWARTVAFLHETLG